MHDNSIWDFWAGRYERLWVQKYSLGPTRREIIRKLRSIIKPGKSYKVLDMGCGTGQFLREMQTEYYNYDIEYTGVDKSSQMVGIAKEKSDGIKFIISGAEEFLSDTLYDVIVCSHSFPYYNNQQEILNNLGSMIKDGGYLMMAQASQNNLYDSLIMAFVKLTTSSAIYPSVRKMKDMLCKSFSIINTIRIKERFFMPSIYLFVCIKGEKL